MNDDDILNFLSFPPRFHKPNSQASQETSQPDPLTKSSSEFDTTQDFCVSTSQFLEKITRIFLAKMQAYENKNEEIERIIHKEKLLEESVRTLKNIIVFLCVIAVLMMLVIFSLLIFIHIPECHFIKQHITASISIELGAIGLFGYLLIRSYVELQGYSARIDSIERFLKLNGKQ